MAIDFAKVTNVVQEFAPQLFVDTITRRSMAWNLFDKVAPSSPQGPRWQVKTAGSSNAAPFAEGDAAPTPDEFEKVQASLSWGAYHSTIRIGGLSRRVLGAASESFIADYVGEQFRDQMADMIDEINADLLGGATTNGVTGLTAAISDTGTYAGLLRSTYSTWQSYVNDNSGSGRAATMALYDTTHNNLVDTNEGNYDLILCDQDQWDNFTALASGNGFPASASFQIMPGQPALEAVAGFTGARYKGRPVIAVPGYTAGRADFLMRDAFTIEILEDFSVIPLSIVNDDMTFYATIFLQAKLRNPKKDAASLQDLNT